MTAKGRASAIEALRERIPDQPGRLAAASSEISLGAERWVRPDSVPERVVGRDGFGRSSPRLRPCPCQSPRTLRGPETTAWHIASIVPSNRQRNITVSKAKNDA